MNEYFDLLDNYKFFNKKYKERFESFYKNKYPESCNSSDLFFANLANSTSSEIEVFAYYEDRGGNLVLNKKFSVPISFLTGKDFDEKRLKKAFRDNFKFIEDDFLNNRKAVVALLEIWDQREPEDYENRDVHTEHCCIKHYCKYDNLDCPVTNYDKVQTFLCAKCPEKYLVNICLED